MAPFDRDERAAAGRHRKGRAGTWDDRLMQDLAALWTEGHTTTEIGRRLGISKNAVIGKARRLQLAPRVSPIGTRAGAVAPHRSAPRLERASEPAMGQEAPASAAAVAPPPQARASAGRAPRPTSTTTAPVPAQHERQCCWPVGEPGTPGFRFCEAHAETGRPYCAEHVGIAYVRRDGARHDAALDSDPRQPLVETRRKAAATA